MASLYQSESLAIGFSVLAVSAGASMRLLTLTGRAVERLAHLGWRRRASASGGGSMSASLEHHPDACRRRRRRRPSRGRPRAPRRQAPIDGQEVRTGRFRQRPEMDDRGRCWTWFVPERLAGCTGVEAARARGYPARRQRGRWASMDIYDLPQADAAPLLRSTNPLIQWVWDEGWTIASLPALARGLGRAMVAAGIPVMRLRLTLRTMHPQLAGLSHSWLRDGDTVEEFWPPLSVLREDTFLKSPYALLFQGAGAVRRRLDIAGPVLDFPILADLRAQGATDYVALPMVFSDGRINAITLATDRPGGFTTAELRTIAEMLPVLARLMEMHALRRTAKTVLETYLGHLTGERVLDGLIHRGEGEDIHAVIWLCDLRGSTPLADALPRRVFLELLNDYFECMAGAVLTHRGEVLKFIGDAMLAIFPIGAVSEHPERCPEHARACADAIAAAREAMRGMADLNRQRAERRQPP